jgi:hypothetical protein
MRENGVTIKDAKDHVKYETGKKYEIGPEAPKGRNWW